MLDDGLSVRDESNFVNRGARSSAGKLHADANRRCLWLGLFNEFPDIWTWAGAIIIFCATTYAVRRGAKTPEKSATA